MRTGLPGDADAGPAGHSSPRSHEGHALWADVQALLACPVRDAAAVAALSARVRAWVAHVSGEERCGELTVSFRKSLRSSAESPPASPAPPQAQVAPRTPTLSVPHAADAVLPSFSAMTLGSDESEAGPSWAKDLGTSPPPPSDAGRFFDSAQKTCSNASSPVVPPSSCTSMYPPRNVLRRSVSDASSQAPIPIPIPVPIPPPATETMAMYYPDDHQPWSGPPKQWPGPAAHHGPGPGQSFIAPLSPTRHGQQHVGFARSQTASPFVHPADNVFYQVPRASVSAPLPSSWGRPEQMVTSVELELSAAKLDKKDLFGKSDGYVIIKADGVELARTNTVKKSLDPEWEPVTLYFKDAIRVADIANKMFSLEVWDYDKGKSDDEIGSATCSLLDMKRRTNLTLIASKNRRRKRSKSSGTLFITKCVPQVFTAYA